MREVQRGLFGNSVQETQNLSRALKEERDFNRKYFGTEKGVTVVNLENKREVSFPRSWNARTRTRRREMSRSDSELPTGAQAKVPTERRACRGHAAGRRPQGPSAYFGREYGFRTGHATLHQHLVRQLGPIHV